VDQLAGSDQTIPRYALLAVASAFCYLLIA
jgi:hypothetical protein